MGTLSYLKTRNLTSLFRFKAFLFQRVRPFVNVAPRQLGEKEGLWLISCSASRVSRARRDSEDRRANRAASDRPSGLTFHHHDCRRRFAATQMLCPFHRARHKPGQSDKPGDLYPWRSAPRSEEHTSELQSPDHLVCRLLLEKKKNTYCNNHATKQKITPHTTTAL